MGVQFDVVGGEFLPCDDSVISWAEAKEPTARRAVAIPTLRPAGTHGWAALAEGAPLRLWKVPSPGGCLVTLHSPVYLRMHSRLIQREPLTSRAF